jgi:hypothetical protein
VRIFSFEGFQTFSLQSGQEALEVYQALLCLGDFLNKPGFDNWSKGIDGLCPGGLGATDAAPAHERLKLAW